MFRNLVDQPFALVIIVVAVVLLFGYKRLPDAARSIGRSMRIFKSEVKQMKDDGTEDKDAKGGTPAAATTPDPLEGRIVADDLPSAPSPVTEHHRNDPARHDV